MVLNVVALQLLTHGHGRFLGKVVFAGGFRVSVMNSYVAIK